MDGMGDIRICFFGDSYVAGVGDPEGLGWVGRLTAKSRKDRVPLTAYNLGVRRDTSQDVLDRLPDEAGRRLADGADNRLVVSFGANDTMEENGKRRVEAVRTIAALSDIVKWTRGRKLPLLVVGPPAVIDDAHNRRLLELTLVMQEFTRRRDIAFVPLTPDLHENRQWRAGLAAGDGAHPSALGYEVLTSLVLPGWWSWLGHAGR
jgi:acyl-CoA thioesterase-1